MEAVWESQKSGNLEITKQIFSKNLKKLETRNFVGTTLNIDFSKEAKLEK